MYINKYIEINFILQYFFHIKNIDIIYIYFKFNNLIEYI